MIGSVGEVRAVCRLEVRGTVQGVGFRPFVYRLAQGLGLDGWVRNAGAYVLVDEVYLEWNYGVGDDREIRARPSHTETLSGPKHAER